jgi:hypothetical protein
LYSFVKVGSALGVINKNIEVYSNGALKTEKMSGYKIGQGEVKKARISPMRAAGRNSYFAQTSLNYLRNRSEEVSKRDRKKAAPVTELL